MPLFVAGLSHRNARVEVREQLAVEEDKLREVLADLQAAAVLARGDDRVDVQPRRGLRRGRGPRRGAGAGLPPPGPPARRRPGPGRAARSTRTLGGEAVRHAFRVAASLDSMMLGEPQILGQVKDAFALAQSCEHGGAACSTRSMSQAFGVAKRVRTETEVGRHAVSVSFAAVELAREDLRRASTGKAVLLVGAGEMSELAARHLVEHGRVSDLRRQSHLEPGPGSGPGAGGTRGAVRRARDRAGQRGHRGHLDRRDPSRSSPRPTVEPASARAPRAAAVLHRHRRAPQRGAGGERLDERLLLRHRRSRAGGRGQPARARSARPSGPRRSSSARWAKFARASRERRGGPDHRVAAGEARGDPARRARSGRSAGCPAPTRRRGGRWRRCPGHRQQDPARADRQAAGLLARRARPAVDRADLGARSGSSGYGRGRAR